MLSSLSWKIRRLFMRQQVIYYRAGQWQSARTRAWHGPALLIAFACLTVVPTVLGLRAHTSAQTARAIAEEATARMERQLMLSNVQQDAIELLRGDLRTAGNSLSDVLEVLARARSNPSLDAATRGELSLWQQRANSSAQALFDSLLAPQMTMPGALAALTNAEDARLRSLEATVQTQSGSTRAIASQQRLRAALVDANEQLKSAALSERRRDELAAELAMLTEERNALRNAVVALSRPQSQPLADTSPSIDALRPVATYFEGALDAARAREAQLSLALSSAELRLEQAESQLSRVLGDQRRAVENLENFTTSAVATAEDMLIYMGLSSKKLAPQLEALKGQGYSIGDRELLTPPARESVDGDSAGAGKGGPFEALAAEVVGDFGGAAIADLSAQTKSLEQLKANVRRLDYYRLLFETLPLGRPIPDRSKPLTSTFGRRTDPFNGRPSFHRGIDYGGDVGDPVVATGPGVVTSSRTWAEYGEFIEIRHLSGLSTRYAHLSQRLVEVGNRVEQGEKIGLVGSTGRSTAPHLHYEVKLNGDRIDPRPLVEIGLNIHREAR